MSEMATKKKSNEVEEFEAGAETAEGAAVPSGEPVEPTAPVLDTFINPADGRKYRRRHELVGNRWLDWSEPAE